ncbi:sensor histidine kinase [Chitinophaga rhizophila]|uniref:Histidine kinase n=1 Tax=Chitinophaga rhizophila TaxID=2866212 RepID=A0ABS7G8L4_9BACT|nr:histidine kinase [Chitinophaga rhizophila]MBW8683129.1 histidine kinase [Chitinophaga rhizophila]
MWKQYRILGFMISLGIGLAAVPIKLTGSDVHSGGLYLAVRTIRYTFTAGFLAFFLHLWLNRKYALLYNRERYLAYLFSIIFVAIAIFLASILFDLVFSRVSTNSSLSIAIEDLNWYLIILRCLLISSVQFLIVFYLQLLRERQNRIFELEKLKQAQLEADLSNLKEQMSPHFLFNTLNTLISITREKQVKDYVADLASVYRYMLVHNKLHVVFIENELNFIKSYLYIIKTRLGSAIEIDIDLDRKLMQTLIPPLTFQLLLENAIKHNVASVVKPLRIQIYNDSSFIIVSNHLNPTKSQYYSTGVGLSNLLNRYQLLFSGNLVIEKSSTMFTVKLPIYEDFNYRE